MTRATHSTRFRTLSRIVAAITLMFAAAMLVAPRATAQTKPAPAKPVVILALGTSLTQGYGLPPGTDITALLSARLAKSGTPVRIVNAGVSGDTSAEGLARLEWSLGDRPDVAMIELGSNDALRALPPERTRANLDAILTRLDAAKIPVLLLGMKAPRNLGPDYARAFDSIYPDMAKKHRALFYPFLLDGVALNPKLNQADGMHPNPAGAKIIADRIYPLVAQLAARARR